jgi:glycosyltransferase involved in cell wall biosynthesis
MKVLFVAGACPYPPDSGGTVRTFNLLKRLCSRHEITLVAPSKPGVDLDDVFGGRLVRAIAVTSPGRTMRRALGSLLSPLPYIVRAHENPAMRAAVHDALATDHFDLLHCDSISVVPAIPDAAVAKTFNAHNIEAMIWERYVREERRPWMIPVLRSQLAKVAAYEADLPRQFDCCIAVSEEDRAEMRRRYGAENVSVVANGVDLDFYSALPDQCAPGVAFVGSLDWRPNQDAVRWLLESIWPLVLAQAPGARLCVVGRRPPHWVASLCGRANASLCADVPDVRPYLADASVLVVPLRIGGGSRLKILEAMAAGRSIVSTTIGAEGLDVRAGEHLMIADEPASFAREVVSLLGDPARRQSLAGAGRALVESQYGWDRISLDMEEAWRLTAAAETPGKPAWSM